LHISRLRTLQIGDDWPEEKAGGLGRYFYELLRHLPATGTTAYAMVVGSSSAKEIAGGKIVAFARPDASIFRRLRAARRTALDQIDSRAIDLIASHFALYTIPMIDRLRSLPTVVHFHGPWSGESGAEGAARMNSRFKKMVENIVYSRAKRMIVLSRSFEQELIRRYGVAEEIVRVVPGGTDLDRFNMNLSRAEARSRLGWPTDRPIILSVRRLVRRMGLEHLLDAVRMLTASHPDLLVLLGGTGPISAELHQRIVEYGLESHVRLLGRIEDADLPLTYRAADMTVVPSQALEGFGLVTLESLASGTPVFVTPVGGLPETVMPFAPECVFAGTSSAEMASVLGEALRGTRTIPTADACRAYACSRFSWAHIAEQVRGVYDEAME
jgi:glycosyltransferase involved in cell wall biosynthesis